MTDARQSDMPRVPKREYQFRTGNGEQLGVPSAPGIYFIWERSEVVYVGQSVNLNQRLRFAHGHVNSKRWVSWLLYPVVTRKGVSERMRAETYFIWLLWPRLNGTKQPKTQRRIPHGSPLPHEVLTDQAFDRKFDEVLEDYERRHPLPTH